MRWQDTVLQNYHFYQVVTSTLFFVVMGKQENSTVKDAGMSSSKLQEKKKCCYCLNLDNPEAAGEIETNTKPNSILNNISHPLYGDIRHLPQHPKVQHEGLTVLICSTHQQTPSFLNGPLVSAIWEGVGAGRLY